MRICQRGCLALLALLLVCIWPGVAGSETPIITQIAYTLDGEPIRIPSMLQLLSQNTRIQTGVPLSRDAVRRSIEAIHDTGTFGQVTAVIVPFEGEYLLRFDLTSKVLVEAITFTQSTLPILLLKDAVQSRQDAEYSADLAESDRERLVKLHHQHGYLQCTVEWSARPTDGNSRRMNLYFQIKPGNRAKVENVSFVGARSIGHRDLRSGLKNRQDAQYSEQALALDAERVAETYRQRGYLTVRVETKTQYDEAHNVVGIIYQITEGKRFVVKFEGKDVDDEELRDRLGLLQQKGYSPATLDHAVQQIRRFYNQQGRSVADVTYQVDQESDETVTIRFDIALSSTARVRQITFEGNEAFPAEVLRQQMELGPPSRMRLPGLGWLFSAGTFDTATLEMDRRALELFYRKAGFPDIVVTVRRQVTEDNRVDLHFVMQEGKQQRVERVFIRGARELRSQELMDGLQATEGKPYSPDLITQDVLYLRARYDDYGYIHAQIEPRFDTGSGTLVYEIREGTQVTYGALHISGHRGVQEHVLKREFDALKLQPGEVLRPRQLSQAQQRLFRLGLFRAVYVETPGRFETTEYEALDVHVRVERQRAGSIGVSGGYSPSEGYRGTLALTHSNLLRRNMRSSLQTSIGTRGNAYEFTLTEPWLALPRTGALLTTFRLFEDNLEELDQTRARGGSLSLSKRLGQYSSLSVQYQYQELLQEFPDLPSIRTTVSSGGISFRRDRRDHVLNPTNGRIAEVALEYAGGILQGQTSFLKVSTDHRLYRPFKGLIFATAIRLGYAQGLRGNREREIIGVERYSAGGSTTVRGYAERSLGPLNASGSHRGDILLVFNSEIRFPVYRFLGGVVFLDTGNTWDKLTDINDSPLHSSVGFGLRMHTPIGPFRVDVSYPLRSGFDSPLYWLELGHAF